MRQFTWAAAAAAAAFALSALGNQPEATAATTFKTPPAAGRTPLLLLTASCPPLFPPRCANGYRAHCKRWGMSKGQKPPCRGCSGWQCVPVITNQQTKQPFGGPKPLPGSRRVPPSPVTR